jgi:enoyl-CoA hydratase/carnithine racemase
MNNPILVHALTQGVSLEMQGQVAVVRLCRPAKRNALNDGLVQALRDVFQNLPAEAGAAVIHGEGYHI